MKTFLKAALLFFTRNFGLKLLALVLAVIIYYSVRESINTSRVPGPYQTPSFMKG